MSSYRTRLEALVADLRCHPCLELLDASFGAPVDEARIRELERGAGLELPAAAHAFYRELDGAQVFWRVRRDLPAAIWTAYLEADREGWYIDPEPTHGLLIGRLDAVLGFQQWPREFSVLGSDGDPALAERILPFDFYLRRGNEDACMAMILADPPEQTQVAMLVSSGCYYPSHAYTDLASYFELMLASRGEISVRQRFEETGGALGFSPEQLLALEGQLFRRPANQG